MKIYIAKTLIEGRHRSQCYVKLSTSKEDIKTYAANQIEVYADTNDGRVTLNSEMKWVMVSNDITVTISIEEQEV